MRATDPGRSPPGRTPTRTALTALIVLLAVVAPPAATTGIAASPPARAGATEAADGEPTRLDSCTVIDEPGRYALATDLRNVRSVGLGEACIEIRSGGVTLDGRGHIVDGVGVTDSVGVAINATGDRRVSDVTVRNVSVSDWNRGVAVDGASSVRVVGVDAADNAYGLAITNASDVSVRRAVVSENVVGISLDRASADADLVGVRAERNRVIGVRAPVALVRALDRTVWLDPPGDPDGDGRHEDTTGDGLLGLLDPGALAALTAAETLGLTDLPEYRRAALDFDRDGRLDFGDSLALLIDALSAG